MNENTTETETKSLPWLYIICCSIVGGFMFAYISAAVTVENPHAMPLAAIFTALFYALYLGRLEEME